MATQPHRFSTSVLLGGATYSSIASASASQLVETTEAIATATTDGEIAITIDVSEVASFVIVSTQNVTVEINDGSSPDYTFTLLANVPQFWHSGMLGAFPLEVDVTSVFVTNASGATADVTISVYQDATP